MGSEFLGVGVEIMRKGLSFTIRCWFRSVYNHPFLVGFLCFLILLHRSSPLVFSVLVSASPVLVCTAVLLGLLLSYGEANVPDIEVEGRETKFETNGSCFGEEGEGGLDAAAVPLIEERSLEIESGSGEIRECEGDLKVKTEWVDEKFNEEVVESEGEESEADSFDSEKVNVASLDSPPRSPWTQIEEEEDQWVEEEEDASMVDIMPMLDELHPLLDEETSHLQPVGGSSSGSDVASERSSDSSTDSRESDEVSEENNENDDDDNEEDGDDAQGEKEELTKSGITWTDEDQKNLMNLGSSEIERNQRLENLILKRRSRKDMSMIHERNLIDLESTYYALGLAPISTRRRNPFDDLHHDSCDHNLGLPLIPGSAPSVMLQRRNPFDIPYDSTEEKPDLMAGGFQEEFTMSRPRGEVFRRHESFNLGPSVFAPNGNGERMRPYFVPESMISEDVADHYQQETVTGSVEAQATEYHPNNKGDEHVYRGDSSSSSLSEVSERVFTEVESEGLSVESIHLSVSGQLAIDIPHRAPVYDSSPRQNENSIMPETSTTQSTHPMDADDDAYQRADGKLISTSSVEGNAYPFHDTGEVGEPNSQHLDEVQASSALVELDSSEYAQITQNLNTPEVQHLDRDIQSNINSPFSPKSISNPPSATTETTEPHFNVQTTLQQVDDIKEIDEDILAELDSVGDFSVQQWGTGSTGFEKRFDFVKENEIEADAVRSEKWREDIDIHKEDVECVSEPLISESSGSEHVEVSRTEVKSEALVENEITYSMPELEAGKIEDTDVSFKEITAKDTGNHGYEDNLSGTPEVEVQPSENNDSFHYTSKLAENEVAYQGRVDIETAYGMNELKASNVEDIDLAFKDISAKETVVEGNLVEHSKNESSSVAGSTLETVEEDTSLGSTQSLPDKVDRAMHVIGSEETQHISSRLDVAGKSDPLEEAQMTVLELLKPNLDDESVEVEADEVSPFVVESGVQEISVAAEKAGNEVKVPKDSDSITYVNGKDSKGLSSS